MKKILTLLVAIVAALSSMAQDRLVVKTQTNQFSFNVDDIECIRWSEWIEPYVDLGLSVKWASCNVGAANPEGYGGYFTWGETEPKTQFSSSDFFDYDAAKYNNNGGQTTLSLADDAAYKSSHDMRMPTEAEWAELRDKDNCQWEWTTKNGVKGYKVTSLRNGKSIFLPAAGKDDDAVDKGIIGNYWSSSLYPTSSYSAYATSFGSSLVYRNGVPRYHGCSIRPVSDGTDSEELISTDTKVLMFSSASSSQTISLKTNDYWEVSVPKSWIKISKTEGKGATDLTVTVDANTDGSKRFSAITLKCNGGSCKVYISQEAYTAYSYVDLGLSVKWATCNVGASDPTQPGNYYAWGEKVDNKTKFTSDTYFDASHQTYSSSGETVLGEEHDMAFAERSSYWRIPSDAEWRELRDNCNWQWGQQGVVNGYWVTSRKNGNRIFLPCTGSREGTSNFDKDVSGFYWSNTLAPYESDYATSMGFYSDEIDVFSTPRHRGLAIRPVFDDKFIDLALSVWWAQQNVGASNPLEAGNYYAWGETQPKDVYSEENYFDPNYQKYNMDNKELSPEDDAAHVNWGGYWRMPDESDVYELYTFCTITWDSKKNGIIAEGPNGKFIFLPAAGRRINDAVKEPDEFMCWSSTLASKSQGRYFVVGHNMKGYSSQDRRNGLPVRPVRSKKYNRTN